MDESIREYMKKNPGPQIPEDYEEHIRAKFTEALGREKRFRVPKIAVAVFTVVFLMVVGMGTYAAVDYVQERMSQLTEDEKEKYVSDIQSSLAEADTFSRELTEKETERLKELQTKYEDEGLYPIDQIFVINSEQEVVSDRICFLPKTSTFYLPKTELSDEDILELIDYYYSLQYSLEQQNETEEYQVAEISGEKAIRIATKKMEDIYAIEASDYSVTHEKNQFHTGGADASEMYVTFSKVEQDVCCIVTVDLQIGKVTEISFETDDDIYADGLAFDEQQIDNEKDAEI